MFGVLEYQTIDHDWISRGSIVFDEQPRGHTRTVQDTLVQLQVTLTRLGVVTSHIGSSVLGGDSLVVHTFGDKHRVADAHTPDSSGNGSLRVFP